MARNRTGAEDAIYELLLEYTFRIDAGDLEGFAELFRCGSWAGLDGYDAVLEWLRQHVILYEGKTHTRHILSNVRISVADDALTASAKSYITLLQERPGSGKIEIISGSVYCDRFECIDGVWVYRRRDIEPQLRGDRSGLVTVLCRSPISLCHLGFERERADAA